MTNKKLVLSENLVDSRRYNLSSSLKNPLYNNVRGLQRICATRPPSHICVKSIGISVSSNSIAIFTQL